MLADYERRGWNIAGFEGLATLEGRGFITRIYKGWGCYEVKLTTDGRKALKGGCSP